MPLDNQQMCDVISAAFGAYFNTKAQTEPWLSEPLPYQKLSGQLMTQTEGVTTSAEWNQGRKA